LAELFGIWETRNGARARELNRPAATYVATRDGIGIGGSDDHAGVEVGRTWTETPSAGSPQEFLAHVRAGRATARGAHGSAAKWAHAAIALAARSLAFPADGEPSGRPDPGRVMTLMLRLLREGDAREGQTSASETLSPADARCLLRAWLTAVELDHLGPDGLIAYLQDEDFSHSALYRRACRLHEHSLRAAVGLALRAATGEAELLAAAQGVFDGCIAAIPYVPATAFLANEQAKLDPRNADGESPRVAILADGIGSTHGVTRTIEEVRGRGVAGFEIEIVGTDPQVDRRLSAVAEIDVPYYPSLEIGVPSLPAAVQTLAEGAFDLIHVCSPGPSGVAGALLGRALGLPLIGSYHTELAAYAHLRSGQPKLADAMASAVAAFYRACDLVLSPSPASDDALSQIGVPGERIVRWDRGVDTARFDPSLRDPGLLPREKINVLYSGRITREKGADLLADAFLRARAAKHGLQLVLAGGGPEQEHVRERVGDRHTTVLGWLSGSELARAYASADIFLFPSATDTFGQVILEAQASGLPVIAVAEGGPASLIEHGVSGLLCPADASAVAEAVLGLARSPLQRARLARAGLTAARSRSWERALERLAEGYGQLLAPRRGEAGARAA
jgi:glycosyltransferase involved in cell wall biosynthesis